jgi:hypothetical protein
MEKENVMKPSSVAAGSLSFAAPLALVAFFAAPAARAQLELPQPSPAAKVSQRVGLTDIAVEYSSPGAKGRKVMGELVPFDKPWRTGANASTKITFSKDVKVGGKSVPAGTYSIVTHPSAKGWQLSLNKELGLFQGKDYDPKLDQVRVPATTAEIPHRERFTILFADTTADKTSLDLEWERLRVSVAIEADTATQVAANIKSATENAWRVHANAARYLLDNGGDLATALKYADQSVGIQSTWFNNWIRAQILKKQNNSAEAKKAAQVALELGNKDPRGFFFKDQVTKAVAEW